MDLSTFTHEQVDNLRKALGDLDKKTLPKTIDMSVPVVVPYVYRPFPKLVYNHDNCLPSRVEVADPIISGGKPERVHQPAVFDTKTVNNEQELQAALADGWKAEAPDFNAPKTAKRSKVA